MPGEQRREFSFVLPDGKRATISIVVPPKGALKYDADIADGPKLGGYSPRTDTDDQIRLCLIHLYTHR